MKPHLLARIETATELVKRRDLEGAMQAIRAALTPTDDSTSAASNSDGALAICGQPLEQIDLTALPSPDVPPTGLSELNEFATQFPLGRRVPRPLPEVLASLKGLPTAAFARGLSLRKQTRVVPDTLPEGATFEVHFFAYGSAQRNYKLDVPSHPAGARRPLVVMLHGCKQDADDFAVGTKMNRLAEELNVLIAYPEQSSAANNLKCWNWFNPQDQRRDAGEPAIIAGITREIVANYAIDPAKIFVAGLSAGGAMAVVMGKTYPDMFSAVGVHSGLPYQSASDVPSAFAAMRNGRPEASPGASFSKMTLPSEKEPRYIVFHGEADTTVHPGNGERLFMEACERVDAIIDLDNDPAAGGPSFRRRIATTSGGASIAEHWTIPHAGHAWSGGDARGSYVSGHGPDASREMMRFFLAEPAPLAARGH